MEDVINLSRWEWFKLRQRWMPWILLAILLLFSQLVIWGSFFSYRHLRGSGGEVVYGIAEGVRTQTVSCNDLGAGRLPASLQNADPAVLAGLQGQCAQAAERLQTQLQTRYADFTLPGSLQNTLRASQTFSLILLTILTASVVGAEYGLGTLRPILTLGTGRWQCLAGKVLVLLAASAAALALLAAVIATSSVATKAFESSAPGGAAIARGWSGSFTTLGRTWFSLLPYVALTGLVTVLTRSSASGMAIGLGYYFAEQVAVALLSSFFDWFSSVADYLLGHNMSSWAGGGFGEAIARPSDIHAMLVLAAYALALGGLAFRVFQRRDVLGATGG